MDQALKQVKRALSEATHVVVLVGGGLSAEPDGLLVDDVWSGIAPEHIATPDEFRQDPGRVWRWYMDRRTHICSYRHGTAHQALATLCDRMPGHSLMTSNIDGVLDRLDGLTRPLELHGNVWRTRCTGCGRIRAEQRNTDMPLPPRCDHCSGALRPDVVWFGEALNANVLDQAVRAACLADVMLLVGTKSVRQPAASLAAHARENNGLVVEVGPLASVAGFTQVALMGEVHDMLEQLALFVRPPRA